MDISTGLLLLLVGIIAGGYGTIVGAGGGFIFVPVLLMVFQLKPAVAAGSGLVIVLINAISGVVGYARKGQINYWMGMTLAIGALPGSLIGFLLLQLYSSNFFYILFASILVCLGIFLMVKNTSVQLNRKQVLLEGERDGLSSRNAEFESVDIPSVQSKWLLPLGFLMGILSSYLGIGGGWLLVPILIYLFHVSTHQATATSIFSLCIYSSAGVFLHFYYGSFDWFTIVWGGAGVTIGAQFGVIMAQKIPGKIVLQMLSVLLIIIGFRMYLN
ncbi:MULTISPECIES: sulfite exporter TauE/SafE family protein [Neobacillus]|uniref:Probable membrane transporter protein n=1 Tax=Neobacillus rhizophilus TaxID=2833579 RepID=A0A942YSX8_9BACI|nr:MULTISPECIES: sulfite exporter TauE/SafE family protein [Neobacillus]MBS4211619.1 sulfite exporter TauE/SafE family protein [Neobacillus rhizophilus]